MAFKRGSKTLGTAKLASLDGSAKVSLKLKKKGLKKGSYQLVVNAKRSDGSNGAAYIKVLVK